MGSLFENTDGMDNITDIYNQMEANYRGSPCSESKELWKLQYECNLFPSQQTPQTMLDKAVAMLAARGHMHGWFNRCPVAAGIIDPRADNNYRVDLVHWSESSKHARLVKLKWKWQSNDPLSALMQILRYGAAYIFCRVHRNALPLRNRPLMDAHHVSLEVVAPYSFCRNLKAQITKTHDSFIDNSFVDSKISGLKMSLKVLAFPDKFQIPFTNGGEVKSKCDTVQLTPEGQAVRDAFNNLTQIWP